MLAIVPALSLAQAAFDETREVLGLGFFDAQDGDVAGVEEDGHVSSAGELGEGMGAGEELGAGFEWWWCDGLRFLLLPYGERRYGRGGFHFGWCLRDEGGDVCCARFVTG